jgi:glyoxylase-like metal-dependent hydrolase (beta-lactamase superfamily II)
MNNITKLDTNWVGRPHSIAAALLESNGHRAIIDPGPASTFSTLSERLASRGLSLPDLDAILLTHIHLDHAGASGSLVRENPRLRVYVHKQGAPHLIDPAKLLASAARLWPDTLQQLFGDTLPVPAENVQILEGGETLTLGSRKLNVVYTPGHASHHVSYFDDSEGLAFVGDTTGIRINNGPYILPATPPPDIDLTIWDASLAAILARRPSRLFLTHFGYAENPGAHILEFRDRLRRWARIAAECLRSTAAGSSASESPAGPQPAASLQPSSSAPASGTSKSSADSLLATPSSQTSGPAAANEAAAMESFVAKCRAEMEAHLGAAEAEHHAFTAGLDLSFRGLARYLRKQATTAA